MLKTVKAFGVLDQFVDTVAGDTAPAGELSPYSRTFSTNKDTLTDDAKDAGHAVVFHSADANGDWIDNLAEYRSEVLDAVELVATFDDDTTAEAQFTAVYDAPTYSDVSVGPGVLLSGRHIPEYVQFTRDIGADTYTIKIWFVDSAFQTQYDEHEIRVVPPILNPDDMWASFSVMNSLNNLVESSERLEQVHITADHDPYSKLITFDMLWQDRNTPENSLTVTWYILAYGPEGMLYSNIIAAIAAYLDDNTAHTVEDWVQHFPDLVTANRYTVVPRWDLASISPAGMPVPFYNPIQKPQDVLDKGKAIFPAEDDADVLPYIESGAMFYKGMGLIFIGDANNALNFDTFFEGYSDYSIFDTVDAGLQQINENTKNIIIKLEQLIRLAEDDDGVVTLPGYASRDTVGAATVISAVIGSTLLRVVTKQSFDAIFV